jgi:hypothetical protein
VERVVQVQTTGASLISKQQCKATNSHFNKGKDSSKDSSKDFSKGKDSSQWKGSCKCKRQEAFPKLQYKASCKRQSWNE